MCTINSIRKFDNTRRGPFRKAPTLLANLRLKPLRSDRLGTLERKAKSTIPVELAQTTDRTGNAEQDSVILELSEAIVPKENARMRVDIRVRVGNLSVLLQDARHDLVNGINDLEKLIVRQMLESEFPLASVPRIGLTEDGVAVSGNHLLGIERVPSEFSNGLGIHLLALGSELIGQILDPLEHLLIGKAMERSGKSVQASRIGQVGIGQSRSDEVGGMGRSIATLVIGVDAQVQAHQLVKGRVVVSKHAAEVSGIIEGGVLVDNAIKVRVAVDGGSNLGQLGNDVENILEDVVVVVGLGNTVGVGLGKDRIGLAGIEADGELGHGVHVLGQAVEEGNNVRRKLRAGMKLGSQRIDLLLRRDLRGKEEPEQTLEQRLAIALLAREGREDLLALGDGQTTETNTLLRIEVGGLPKHALDATGTADALIDGNLSDAVSGELIFMRRS